jgi:hypothetical protein
MCAGLLEVLAFDTAVVVSWMLMRLCIQSFFTLAILRRLWVIIFNKPAAFNLCLHRYPDRAIENRR